MRWPSATWRGLTALVLAVGVAATVVVVAVTPPANISVDEASLVSTVLGAAVGALATFLGGHTSPPDPISHDQSPPEPPEGA